MAASTPHEIAERIAEGKTCRWASEQCREGTDRLCSTCQALADRIADALATERQARDEAEKKLSWQTDKVLGLREQNKVLLRRLFESDQLLTDVEAKLATERRLRAQAEQEQWQPIETAKVGDRILVWSAKWDDDPAEVVTFPGIGQWLEGWAPTHWMPLPAAPSVALLNTNKTTKNDDVTRSVESMDLPPSVSTRPPTKKASNTGIVDTNTGI